MVDFSAIRPSQASRAVSERDRVAEGPARASEADGTAPQDKVTLSPEAQRRAQGADGEKPGEQDGKVSGDGKKKDEKGEGPKVGKGKLTQDQQREVTWLQQRDTHVRQHEAAHQAAGGSLTGGATFSYQIGPDGRSYAVGGEVPVRLQSGRTPEETISNARQARRAALAPSDPSPADLAVAASATELEQAALAKKARMVAKAYARQSGADKAKGKDDAAGQSGQTSYQGSLEASDDEGPAGATRVAA